MTLRELAIGETCVIKEVGGEGALRQHFLDMGVIPGVEVTLIKLAPMGDPMELRIHGYERTLRLADADQINVELVKDIVKKPKKSIDVLKSVGLDEHADKFPSQLSGGEQQRVAVARAIAKDPEIILADEPTGALDSKTGVEVLKLLRKQCDERNGANTVIIVTHNSLIADIADRVIRLKNGEVESNTVNKNPKKIDEVVW